MRSVRITKIILGIVICAANLLMAASGCFAQTPQPLFKIGIAVLNDNPDYRDARDAFMNSLQEREDIDVQFELFDGQGNEKTYARELKKFIEYEKIDLLLTTGTRSTLPVVREPVSVPVVFTAVAAPLEADIVTDLVYRDQNITGTHCGVLAYAQIKIILKVLPFTKKLGIVYTQGEPNAEIQLKNFQEAARILNLEVITSTIDRNCESKEEVAAAARQLAQRVDVFVMLQDTSLSRYGQGLLDVADEFDIPTYTSLVHLLSQGALLSLGMNFHSTGLMAGDQAYQILKHKVPAGRIPVGTDSKYLLVINLKRARELGITIPIQVLRTASEILQ